MKNDFANKGITFNKSRLRKNCFINYEYPVRLSDCQIDCNVSIGAFTYIRGGRLAAVRSVGRFCSIAPGFTIGDGEHPLDYLSTHPFQYKGTVFPFCHEYDDFQTTTKNRLQRTLGSIGSDVWIGSGVTILRGIKIGHGAVIGAGSVVTRDVAPYEIVAGIPARNMRYRFDLEIIARLLSISWWNYSLKSLEGVPFENIELALTELESRKKMGFLVKREVAKFKFFNNEIIAN